MADEKSRIGKLEARSRQAEAALQQLLAYVDLLKNKKAGATTGAFSEELKKLNNENHSLKVEVAQLKQQLVTMEIKHGVPQIPVPSQGATPPSVMSTTTAQASVTTPTAPITAAESTPEAPKEKKKSKEQKKAPPPTTAVVDVSRLNFRIGRIVKAWKHPDADSLYIEEVDVGEGKIRTVCSGLTKFVPLEQMQEITAMFLCNLKPAKLCGVVSEAMIMCASTPEKVEILAPPPGCVPGDRVYCEGYEGTPDTQLNPKKKIFEAIQPDLRVNDVGVACYKDTPFRVEGRDGVFKAPSLRNVGIK